MALDSRFPALKVIAPEMDKNRLLLLGLNLLNKGLNISSGVYQPQAVTTAVVKGEVKQSSKATLSSDQSKPVATTVAAVNAVVNVERSRKRKRDSNADFGEEGRVEKRKMMNRVSAQSARDRKKNYVEDLEKKVRLLEEKNKELEEENSVLKEHTSSLAQEKEQLVEKLDHAAEDLKALFKETLLQEPFWLGSAVPRLVSLQQKRFLRQMFFLRVFLAFSLNYWPTSLKLQQQKQLEQYQLKELEVQEITYQLLSNLSPLLRESPWWGASQSNWNPLMK